MNILSLLINHYVVKLPQLRRLWYEGHLVVPLYLICSMHYLFVDFSLCIIFIWDLNVFH